MIDGLTITTLITPLLRWTSFTSINRIRIICAQKRLVAIQEADTFWHQCAYLLHAVHAHKLLNLHRFSTLSLTASIIENFEENPV